MATASNLLGIKLQDTGENANTWGEILNDEALEIIEEAISGVLEIELTGDKTLTSTNFVVNETTRAMLVFTDGGMSAAATIDVPARSAIWRVLNSTPYVLKFDCGGDTASLLPGRNATVWCDGTDCFVFDAVLTATANSAASVGYAQEWAQKAEDSPVSVSAGGNGSTTFSALHWAAKSEDWATLTGAAVSGGEYSAKEYASGTTAPTGSAKEWATVTGAIVDGDYSAKEHATGTTVPGGSAKEWATVTGSLVDGDYSSKEFAIGDLTASGGSAKAWAIDASSPDGSSDQSAKTYAGQASTSASNAAGSASAAATSATNASDSATAAANSAAAAASSAASVDADSIAADILVYSCL